MNTTATLRCPVLFVASEPHEQDETCLMRGKGVCFSSVELSAE